MRDNMALEEDKLHMMTSINFSKRKGKMWTGLDRLKEEVRQKTPNPLTKRELLNHVAVHYDPIGFVIHAKQKGGILIRKAFQETWSGSLTWDMWDKPLSEGLREEADKLSAEYVEPS